MNADWHPEFDAYEQSLVDARKRAAEFVMHVKANGEAHTAGRTQPVRPYWLTITGKTGSGKTELARQIFIEARKYNPYNSGVWIHPGREASDWTRRPGNVWLTAPEFADGIRSDFKLPEILAQDFLVVIDDVGAARDTTSFIADGLYRLCNVRLGKWTIFTTNLTMAEIAKQIDERVLSRMIRDGNIYHPITAGDYAMRKGSR